MELQNIQPQIEPLRAIRGPGGAKNKRIRAVLDVLEDKGIDPTARRLAIAHQLETWGFTHNSADHLKAADSIYADLLQYIQPKRKAIDPTDTALKIGQMATLEQLSAMRNAILAGEVVIDPNTVITAPETVPALEHTDI